MTSSEALQGSAIESRGFQSRLPNTSLGKWSMWLAVAFVAMFLVNMAFVGVFGRSNDAVLNEFSRTYLPYYGIALFAVGFAAGVTGLVAIVRQHERSIVTLFTIAPAAFTTIFVIGELVFPH